MNYKNERTNTKRAETGDKDVISKNKLYCVQQNTWHPQSRFDKIKKKKRQNKYTLEVKITEKGKVHLGLCVSLFLKHDLKTSTNDIWYICKYVLTETYKYLRVYHGSCPFQRKTFLFPLYNPQCLEAAVKNLEDRPCGRTRTRGESQEYIYMSHM